jgi:hypothetical protein
MKSKILQGLAILLIIEIGLTHYFSSQHEFEEAWILGYLFITNFLGALLAAYGIYRRKTWGWVLGFFVAAGSIGGYIWSRTSGLPGLSSEEWLFPWGVTSIIAESLFCLIFLLRPWRLILVEVKPIASKPWGRYLLPVTGLIALVLVNYYTYQWDVRLPEDNHEHVFFLWQVRLQPEMTLTTFEEEYGVQVSLVAVSALDSIVDVRLKILDPEKAAPLFEDPHTALLVGDTLIPSPHIHRLELKKDKPLILFYPNLKNIVKSGTPVSIVFENFRVEPVGAY